MPASKPSVQPARVALVIILGVVTGALILVLFLFALGMPMLQTR